MEKIRLKAGREIKKQEAFPLPVFLLGELVEVR